MKIGALKEITSGEQRVALTPDSAKQLHKLGHVCLIEKNAGLASGFSDDLYKAAGVDILSTAEALTNINRVWGLSAICRFINQTRITTAHRIPFVPVGCFFGTRGAGRRRPKSFDCNDLRRIFYFVFFIVFTGFPLTNVSI